MGLWDKSVLDKIIKRNEVLMSQESDFRGGEMGNVKPNLMIPIGIPGSGKSTWVLKHPEYYSVCPDEIRKKYFKDISDQSNNVSVFQIAKGMVITALELGKNTVLDATNTITFYRREFYKDLPSHKRHALIFEVEPEIAVQRVKNDIERGIQRSNVPEDMIYRCYGDFLYSKKVLRMENFNSINLIK